MNIINTSMKEEVLKRLVEKYYSGTTSEEEEDLLHDYFRNAGDIPDFEAEKAIFGYFSDTTEIPEPNADFEDKIIAAVDASDSSLAGSRVRSLFLTLSGVAAGLLILAGTYFFFKGKTDAKDSFNDPVLAYQETLRILNEVSLKMNKGAATLEPVGKINEVKRKSLSSINRSAVVVEKSLKSINNLGKRDVRE